jgi:hypothetical protein
VIGGVSNLSDEEVYLEIGKIVVRYKILECGECSRAVLEWLRENRLKGTLLKLRTKFRDEDFILSERMIRRGVNESITANGIHYGVEIKGQVFDNLSPMGLSREEWINDFTCPSDQFMIEELDSL